MQPNAIESAIKQREPTIVAVHLSAKEQEKPVQTPERIEGESGEETEAIDSVSEQISEPAKELTGRERSLANLRMGGGRPPKSLLSRRETLLRDIDRYIHKGKRISYWKLSKLAELIEKSDGPTVRWLIDQEIGSPRTTIEQVVEDSTIIMHLATILASKAGQTVNEDLAQDVVSELQAKLKER